MNIKSVGKKTKKYASKNQYYLKNIVLTIGVVYIALTIAGIFCSSNCRTNIVYNINTHIEIWSIFIIWYGIYQVYTIKKKISIIKVDNKNSLVEEMEYIVNSMINNMESSKPIIFFIILSILILISYAFFGFDFQNVFAYFHAFLIFLITFLISIALTGFLSFTCGMNNIIPKNKNHKMSEDIKFIQRYFKRTGNKELNSETAKADYSEYDFIEISDIIKRFEWTLAILLLLSALEIFMLSFMITHTLNTEKIRRLSYLVKTLIFLFVSIGMGSLFIFVPVWEIHKYLSTIKRDILSKIIDEINEFSKIKILKLKNNQPYENFEEKDLIAHILYISNIHFKNQIENLNDWPLKIPSAVSMILLTALIEISVGVFIHIVGI